MTTTSSVSENVREVNKESREPRKTSDDIHSDLPMLKLPTLLLVAGNGGVIQAEDEDEICRIVPGIAVQRIDGAGHMIPWDDLPSFLSAIRRFL